MSKPIKYKKKNGETAYKINVYLGVDPATGKQRRTTLRGFKTAKAATLAEARLKVKTEKEGFKEKAKKMYFKEVCDLWLETYAKTVKPSTLNSQIGVINNHILPVFGDSYVDKITMIECQKYVNHQADKLIRYNNSVNIVYRILEYAKHLGLIKTNPMANTLRPLKKEGKDGDTPFWNKHQLLDFIKAIEQSDLDSTAKITLHLLAYTGMRKGELLALRWSDVDLTKGTLSIDRTMAFSDKGLIFQPTKTKAGTRVISIDKQTADKLKRHRIEQQKLYMLNGKRVDKSTLIISSPTMERYYLDYPNLMLNKIITEFNLPHIPVHGLRHTHCSLLFEAGASIKEVQERLGHKNIKTTMEIYAHVTEQAREQTADTFAKYLTM